MTNFVFAIPIAPFVDDAQWLQANLMLGETLRSVLNQRDGRFRVLIAGHERPFVLDEVGDPRIEFIPVGFAKPRARAKPLPVPQSRLGALLKRVNRLIVAEDGRRRDKRRKRWAIAARFREMGGGYFMYLDADDYVHRDLTAFILNDDNRGGYLIAEGYALDFQRNRLAPIPGAFSRPFNEVCGSSGIFFFEPSDLPARPFPAQRRQTEAFFHIHNHNAFKNAIQHGRPVTPVPFPAAVYSLNNHLNLSNDLVRTLARQASLLQGIRKHQIPDAATVADAFAIRRAVKRVSKMSTVKPTRDFGGSDLAPSMPPREIALLSRHLSSAKVYLEYGCGGTTVLAARSGVERLHSVDSLSNRVRTVREHPIFEVKLVSGLYRVDWVDIDPVSDLGKPTSTSSAYQWPAYATHPWTVDTKAWAPDFILVNGRFRVSCVLQSLLRCDAQTLIAVCDFHRESYHAVLDFTDVVEREDRLVVLRRKARLDPLTLAKACSRFLLESR